MSAVPPLILHIRRNDDDRSDGRSRRWSENWRRTDHRCEIRRRSGNGSRHGRRPTKYNGRVESNWRAIRYEDKREEDESDESTQKDKCGRSTDAIVINGVVVEQVK